MMKVNKSETKHLFLGFLFMIFFMPSIAQTSEEVLQKINAIRADTTYIWSFGTSTSDAEDAAECARLVIGEQIENWLRENNINDRNKITGCVVKAKEELSYIPTQNKKVYRCLSYVKKKDILTFSDSEELLLVEFGKSDSKQVKPTETTKPAEVESKKESEPSTAIHPSSPQATNSAQKAAASKENKTISDTSSQLTSTSSQTASSSSKTSVSSSQATSFQPTNLEQSLLKITKRDDLDQFILTNYNKGIITSFGTHSNIPKIGPYHLVLFDKNGDIQVCFRVDKNGQQLNITTGKADSMSAYKGKGYGAYWFIFK